ncbi:MAG: leucine-rich repeat domain-containing protein [Clostridia bacterium]|nr:leucine-rich repeat domain-containing protein [Clostridia bacterium]
MTDQAFIYKDVWEYHLTGDSVAISRYKGSERDVVIPRKIEGKAVTSIAAAAFLDCSYMKSIIIPDTIYYIGAAAFKGCRELSAVTLPDYLNYLGDSAFYGCHALESVSLPDSLSLIASYTFCDCVSLVRVKLPKSLSYIGDGAFSSCFLLNQIALPDTVEYIGYEAFMLTDLDFVSFGKSIRYIDENAFDNCSSLREVSLPEGLEELGSEAFANCTGLIHACLPLSLTSIGEDAFNGCPSLTISAPAGSYAAEYAELNDINYSSVSQSFDFDLPFIWGYDLLPDDTLRITHYHGQSRYAAIPPWIRGKRVSSIGSSVFSGWEPEDPEDGGLIIIIPSSVRDISAMAFEGCRWIERFEVEPESIWFSSQDGVLYDAACLTLVRFPTYLPYYCLNLPRMLKTIGPYAFSGCAITSFVRNVPRYPVTVRASSMRGAVIIPDGLKTIGDSAFYSCPELRTVSLPESVDSLGFGVFHCCGSLRSVTLSRNIEVIPPWTFAACTSLPSIVLPEKVKRVGDNAFFLCQSLEDIVVFGKHTDLALSAMPDVCCALTITAPKGSAAESFASNAGVAFEPFEEN